MPLHRRIPKRGFHNPFSREFAVVNVEMLERVSPPAKPLVTPELLASAALIHARRDRRENSGRWRAESGAHRSRPCIQQVGAGEDHRAPEARSKFSDGRLGMNKLIEAFRNIFRTPDLRNRVLFTLAIAGGVSPRRFHPHAGNQYRRARRSSSSRATARCSAFIDLFSGGNFRRLTIFALGIMPYITASIILQLMVVVWPYLERLQKEGELGRRKITQYTRYLTIILSVVPVVHHRLTSCSGRIWAARRWSIIPACDSR